MKKTNDTADGYKAKFTEYEAQIAKLREQNTTDRINSAVKMALLSSGASDVDYMTYKLGERLNKDGAKLELDENGNVKGLESRITELKTAFPKMFEGGNTPEGLKVLDEKKLPEGGAGGTEEPKTLAEALKQQYEKH